MKRNVVVKIIKLKICERKKFHRMCGEGKMKSFSMMFKFSCLCEASEIHNEIMMCYGVKFFCDILFVLTLLLLLSLDYVK